jgi:hypothetical protein
MWCGRLTSAGTEDAARNLRFFPSITDAGNVPILVCRYRNPLTADWRVWG